MPLVSAEMGEAIGLSHLFPILPIMNFLSMVLMLLLIPGFWKTRIFALVALVGWIFVGNLQEFVCMIQWRENVDDVPIWADILAAGRRIWSYGFFSSIACFSKFTWERLQPLPVRQLYDKRRRDNIIAAFLTVACPLLMTPSFIFSATCRYTIIEDFGPSSMFQADWSSVILYPLPQSMYCVFIIMFNSAALVSYCGSKQENLEPHFSKHQSSVRTRKLLLMSLINTPLAAYGVYSPWKGFIRSGLHPHRSMAETLASLQLVFYLTKPEPDTDFKGMTDQTIITSIFMPLFGFYLFAWFGLGKVARKSYGDAFMVCIRFMGLTRKEFQPPNDASPLSWSSLALRNLGLQRGSNIPEIPPYPFAIPLGDGSQLPTKAARIQPTERAGNVIDNTRSETASTREPKHRHSTYTLPFAPPAAHSTSRTTHDPSESMPPYGKDPKIRRQPKSSPYTRGRRLSYHKPAFVALPPPRAGISAVDVVGAAIPLLDIQRTPRRNRTTGMPAESTVDAPPPPLPTFPTSTAPPPPSYQRPTTPAPPYQDVNPFHDHVLIWP